MKETSFKVLNVKKENEFVVITADFGSSVNEFRRKFYKKQDSESIAAIIDGCEVVINAETLDCSNIVRLYDTKGIKKKDTSKISKSTKSKDDVKGNKILTPIKAAESKSKEVKHEQYQTIKTCLECNIPIYLAGPAGSGKNFTVEQIAKELGWNFYFSNSVQQEYKLTGFIDASGEYHETEFYKACTSDKHCIFFLDEIDASIPEVLVLLNAAIANGYFEFPNGRVEFDKVHFVAAGNTVGSGADELYTGRMVIDQATLDRFVIIDFDYSRKIEMALSDQNKELVDFIRDLRKTSKNQGIRVTFSYRCITMVTKLEKANTLDLIDILKISAFKGMDKDTINTFKKFDGSNRYYNALQMI